MPFFVKALSLALEEYPIMNSLVNPATCSEGFIQEYIIKGDHNISVAINSPIGLLTPNIKQANRKSILDIHNDMVTLKKKA
jgi:2-oxoisovalerate dehydrogenase E2 component (dihydrolipoyl transacylase)